MNESEQLNHQLQFQSMFMFLWTNRWTFSGIWILNWFEYDLSFSLLLIAPLMDLTVVFLHTTFSICKLKKVKSKKILMLTYLVGICTHRSSGWFVCMCPHFGTEMVSMECTLTHNSFPYIQLHKCICNKGRVFIENCPLNWLIYVDVKIHEIMTIKK